MRSRELISMMMMSADVIRSDHPAKRHRSREKRQDPPLESRASDKVGSAMKGGFQRMMSSGIDETLHHVT